MTFTKDKFGAGMSHARHALAQAGKVTPLFSKDLTNLPGKEGLMVTVEYPPGSSDAIHRHNAYGFIYVLEGSDRDAGERRKGDSNTWSNLL